MIPKMVVVAGPPGSGKSTLYPLSSFVRSDVTFKQARLAKQAGFVVEMRYLALRDFGMHLERVKARADAGGHSASEATLRRTYEASLRNLRPAVQEMDILWVYDNTPIDASHPLVLEARNREVRFLIDRKSKPQGSIRVLG